MLGCAFDLLMFFGQVAIFSRLVRWIFLALGIGLFIALREELIQIPGSIVGICIALGAWLAMEIALAVFAIKSGEEFGSFWTGKP